MIAVITGDIVNSKQGAVDKWLSPLKNCLNNYGKQPIDWEIFRGDSFQLALASEKAFIAAIHLKATIKTSKLHDIRIAIGIGQLEYESGRVSEANGSAFYSSGEAFELLKKQRLVIQSKNSEWDNKINLMFRLALLTANHWSPIVAETVKTAIENPQLSQMELAQLLGKSQSVTSETLKRAGFDEMMALNHYFQNEISTL